jgi:hypothetical protein
LCCPRHNGAGSTEVTHGSPGRLLLILLLFGAGAAIHALWWIAVIALALWLIGFVARPGGRWYRW